MERFSAAKGFIFDCDGTLLDSLDAWREAEAPLFAQTGQLTREQQDAIHSAPIERSAELFYEHGAGESAEAVLALLDGYLLDYYATRSVALPGAAEFVRAVCDAGVPCVVLSSSPRRYLEAGLGHVGLLECFNELVTTDETGCSKQDFAIYERALSILGSRPESTWAVDDAPYAIAVMRDFGLNTIAVGNGCSPERAELLRARATLFAESLAELA